MDEKSYISKEQLQNIKNAFEKVFIKSREFNVSTTEQNMLLDRLINEFVDEAFAKAINEGSDLADMSNEKIDKIKNGFLSELKESVEIWKKEYNKGNSKWWNLLRKRKNE